jgi:DNA-directed RNA polymerase subunit beta
LLPDFGRTYLTDGGTGERLINPQPLEVIYMLKLGHMVDDKMHADQLDRTH